MKKLIALTFVAVTLAVAGPVKLAYTATYPVRHPKKTAKAGKKVVKAGGKAVKLAVW